MFTPRGSPLRSENVRRRVLRPVAEEHTCVSMLFERGANVKQVQKWLGHHSPSFTLDTDVHLLEDQLGEPLSLAEPTPEKSVKLPVS